MLDVTPVSAQPSSLLQKRNTFPICFVTWVNETSLSTGSALPPGGASFVCASLPEGAGGGVADL